MRRSFTIIPIAIATAGMAQQSRTYPVMGVVQFTYANDFFTATDRYFTQGVGLRVGHSVLRDTPLAHVFINWPADDRELISLSAQQDCYTPGSIRSDTIRTGDRPFAAALYADISSVRTDPVRGLRSRSDLALGVLGPCAFCAEEQMWIHAGLGNIEPLGWEYQVAQDLIINYGIAAEKRLLRTAWSEARGGLAAEVGTYRDNATASFTLELGKNATGFDHPLDRPTRLRVKANGRLAARVVAYDASMQGGVFQENDPYVLEAADIQRIVPLYGWGVNVAYRTLDISYQEHYIGRSFKGGLSHAWGSLAIAVWF